MVYFCHARIPDYVIKPAAVEAANPYKDEKKSLACSCTESELSEEEEERLEEEDNVVENPGALRITTRANVPYNLEGYARNALLIMSTVPQHHRTYYEANIREKIIRVTQVFENFRFEIIQHENLTSGQIDQTCQDFFRRDFTDYGCVAVVFFHTFADVIGRHYNTDGNPTLLGKPKLYINEGQLSERHGDGYRPNKKASFYCGPITEAAYPDVLCLQLPSWPNDASERPIQTFCYKLQERADADDLVTIVNESIKETNPRLRDKIFVASTLERKLFLSRTLAAVTGL